MQSTPLRLERALARMEGAAGFAHDSHKPAPEGVPAPPDADTYEARNLLN